MREVPAAFGRQGITAKMAASLGARLRTPGGQDALAVAALTALAGALRFSTLGVQSLWLDESVTAGMISGSLGQLLPELKWEASPPLFYLTVHAWEQVFGRSEVGLRSFSALAGTLNVPVAFLAARELVSRRTALIVALMTAVSPGLVWYSQDVRTYALATLLTSVSFLFFARSLRRPTNGNLGWWAVASSLAMASHYFAAFVVAAEAAFLLLRSARRRAVIVAVAATAMAGAAVGVMALKQISLGGGGFVDETPLLTRIRLIPDAFFTGEVRGSLRPFLVASLGLVVFGLALLVRRAEGDEREGGLQAAGIVVLGGGGLLALSLGGADYLNGRNVLVFWSPLAVAVAAGFRAPRAATIGIVALAGLVALQLAVITLVQAEPRFQREDWRSAARSLVPAHGRRITAVDPFFDRAALEYYLPRARLVRAQTVRVSEIALVLDPARVNGELEPPRRAPPGFRLVGESRFHGVTVLRLRSAGSRRMDSARVAEALGVSPKSLLSVGAGADRGPPVPFVHPSSS